FAAVLGPEDVPRPKPAPDMLLAALAQLGVPPAAALYVGDMVVDIETARGADVAVWVVPTGSNDRASSARGADVAVWVVPTGSNDRATLEAAGPDRVLNDLHELAQVARTWAAP